MRAEDPAYRVNEAAKEATSKAKKRAGDPAYHANEAANEATSKAKKRAENLAYRANEAAKEAASKAKMRAENLAYRANEASKIKDDTNTIMRKATTITNLTRIAHICGYREQLPGTLRYQHGIMNRGVEGLLQ